MTTLTLADARTEIVFDAETGGIASIKDRRIGRFAATQHAALFVLEVPRHGDRTVVVRTEQQRLSARRMSEDGREVELRWDRLVTSAGEALDASVVVTARLDEGAVRLSLEARLGEEEVEAVRFPVLRGIRPDHGDTLEYRGVDYSTGTRIRLLPTFDSNSPYWGTLLPDYASGNLRPEVVCNPTSPVVVLATDAGGISVTAERATLEFIGWRTSLEPGYQDGLLKSVGDAKVMLEPIQFPVPRDGALSVEPIVVAPYTGGWTAGLDRYRTTQRPTRISGAAWLAEPRSWLQVQLMSTEGEARYTFEDLVGIIEECAASGIGVIQIVGWNEGGQDGLVPVHVPAVKLGGEEGLLRALRSARELDVRTVLYAKYVWVEKPGPYWRELQRFACLDANGQPYAQPGPVYHSARKRYGISTPWYVPLCFGVEELRERFAAEVRRMASWGADGVLPDESLYHGRALLCFAEDHGHEPGASTYLWDGEFVEDLRRASRDDFVIVAEGAYDQQFEHYDASYFRSASLSHIPVGRQLRPDARIVTALTGFDDRGMANQCLLYGYGMSLEPFHFKGRPSDAPHTVAYAGTVDRARRRYADWLWNGRMLDRESVDVTVDGEPHPWATTWVARGRDGRVVVIANQEERERLVAVDLEGARVLVVGVDEEPRELDGNVLLPPRSAAIVLESTTL